MREIKFRSWGPNCKTMWDWDETKSLIVNLGWEGEKILLQYTGLKDKNGVEIYEGDLLSDGFFVWFVTFIDGAFWARQKDRSIVTNIMELKRNRHLAMKEDAIEVIGNIYENPELLGGDCNE